MEPVAQLRQDYDLLQVPANANPAEIRRAYLKAIKAVHPDLFPSGSEANTQANQKARALNVAYARIKHAPLRFVSAERATSSAGDRTIPRDESPFYPRSPNFFDRSQLAFDNLPFSTGATRALSYLYLVTVLVNFLLALAVIHWNLVLWRGFRSSPYAFVLFAALSLPLYALELLDRLKNARSHSQESTLGELFAGFSSLMFFAYPFLCFFFALGFLVRGRIEPALWFGLALTIAFTLQRKLGKLD